MFKNIQIRNKLVALAVVALAMLVIGCSRSALKVGWMESSDFNHKRAHYTMFEGIERKSFRMEQGQTLTLDYDVVVEDGALHIEIAGPEEQALWEATFENNDSDAVTVKAEKDGVYTLLLRGDRTEGSFDLSWNVNG